MSSLSWAGFLGNDHKPEKQVQTIIRVHPHFLESATETALATSESKAQTNISVQPDDDDTTCYSSLEYVPFKDIQEKNIRVLNLPRKLCLHFTQSPLSSSEKCLLDDDGINELCIELKERAQRKMQKASVTHIHAETQTDADLDVDIDTDVDTDTDEVES